MKEGDQIERLADRDLPQAKKKIFTIAKRENDPKRGGAIVYELNDGTRLTGAVLFRNFKKVTEDG